MSDKSVKKSILKRLAFIAKIELDYFYQLKANEICLMLLSRNGYLIRLSLPIGNPLVETFLS